MWLRAQLTRGIEKTANALVAELQKLSVEVRDEDLANVATVSAGGNAVVRRALSSILATLHMFGAHLFLALLLTALLG